MGIPFYQETGIPLAGQKLVYRGEILTTGTVQDCGISDDDFLVVIVVRRAKAAQECDGIISLSRKVRPTWKTMCMAMTNKHADSFLEIPAVIQHQTG